MSVASGSHSRKSSTRRWISFRLTSPFSPLHFHLFISFTDSYLASIHILHPLISYIHSYVTSIHTLHPFISYIQSCPTNTFRTSFCRVKMTMRLAMKYLYYILRIFHKIFLGYFPHKMILRYIFEYLSFAYSSESVWVQGRFAIFFLKANVSTIYFEPHCIALAFMNKEYVFFKKYHILYRSIDPKLHRFSLNENSSVRSNRES